MAILWCGGEEIDFPYRSGNVSTMNVFRSAYSRCAINIYNGLYYAKSNIFTGVTSCWLSMRVYIYSWGGSGSYRCLGMGNSSNSAWIGIGSTTTANKVAIIKYDGTTTTVLATEIGASVQTGKISKIDIQIINYGSNGTINSYVDSTLVASYTGDLTVLGNMVLNQVNLVNASATSWANGYVSEVIVADEDTRLMSLVSAVPNAAGDTSTNWTNTYTAIDEVTLDDADLIYSTTNDADFQCNLTGMPTGTFQVRAVKVAANVADPTNGTYGVQLGVKTNSTVNVGSTETLTSAWQTKERLMSVNPVTGVPWTQAEIDALQLNFRAKVI